MNKRDTIIAVSIFISIILIISIFFAYEKGYISYQIKPSWTGDYPYDDYICFVYKIEPRYGEGVGGVPDRLVAYIYTNSPQDRTSVQFEWEDDNNKYLSAHVWLDGYDPYNSGGYVEKLGNYKYKVSYPIKSGHSYNAKSGYRWSLYVWLNNQPHGSSGSAIWEISDLHWIWYKDNRNPTDYTPVANSGGPYFSQVGSRIKLDASNSQTPSGSSLIEYYWDLNDDGIWDKYGKVKYVTFQNTGTYKINLLVINDKAYYDTDETTVTISNVNNPPVADAGGPYSCNVGETITLDGSGSYDPDGNPLSYEWDVDGDGTYDMQGEKVTVVYNVAGTYTVKLKVSDGQYSSTDTTTVTVSEPSPPPDNQPPVADAGGPYKCNVGETITLNGSGSYDPDGYIVSYRWDINGDGVYDLEGEYVQVTFNKAGIYPIILNVTDNDGSSSKDTTSISVLNNQTKNVYKFNIQDVWFIILIILIIIVITSIYIYENRRRK